MKEELPAYQNIKPIKGSLFGFMPESWRVIRLKFVMPNVSVGIVITPSKYYVDDGVPAIRSLNVKKGKLTDDDLVFISEDDNRKLEKTRIYKDDVVIVRTGQTGACAVVDERFDGTNCIDLIIVRKSRHIKSKFLQYFLMSGEAIAEITISSNGAIQQHFNIGLVREISLLQPNLQEQDAIIYFLDRETAKIDRLMDVRRKQIETLQEQRTAVIHHAVTKGLDPQAKMKPSGVEWLGDVSEKWTIKRIKFWVKQISNQVSTISNEFPYIALEHVESKTGKLMLDEEATFDSSVKIFKAGDVLFNRLRPYLAKVSLPDFDGVCVGELLVFRANNRVIVPRYLQLRLLTPDFINLVDGSTQGAKMPRANWSYIGNIKIAFPNIFEQVEIINFIDLETAKLDTLTSKYQRELELLAEYRASLISHAVTGKIDVRGLVEV